MERKGKKAVHGGALARVCNTSSWEVKTGRPQPAWGPGYIARFCPKTQKQIGKTSQWLNVRESDNLSSLEAPWWKEITHSSVVLWSPHTCGNEHRQRFGKSCFPPTSQKRNRRNESYSDLKIAAFWPIALSSVIFSSENIQLQLAFAINFE